MRSICITRSAEATTSTMRPMSLLKRVEKRRDIETLSLTKDSFTHSEYAIFNELSRRTGLKNQFAVNSTSFPCIESQRSASKAAAAPNPAAVIACR